MSTTAPSRSSRKATVPEYNLSTAATVKLVARAWIAAFNFVPSLIGIVETAIGCPALLRLIGQRGAAGRRHRHPDRNLAW
jgi:hypothetical protein